MLKRAAAALTLLAIVACCTPGGQTWNHPNVPMITGPGWSMGSSVVIADGWVLTAKHVLPALTVGGLANGEAIPHPTLDLALIHCPGMDPRGLVIAQEGPKVYDRLYAYGWHAGQRLLRTEGFQGKSTGHMSAPVIFGCSGGAVVNDRGELVGIIVGMLSRKVQGGDGWYALPHISRYTVLDESARNWIGTHIR